MDLLQKIQAALPQGYLANDYIDRGGQGSVFRGELNGEPVALKLFAQSPEQRRIDREVELLSRIDLPYLVKLKGYVRVEIDGVELPLIAYEFLNGGDLRQYTPPSTQRLSPNELITLGYHVGSAIEVLWQHRICHRDIKPGNVVRAADGRFVLVDVGFARHLDRSNITAPGLRTGTMGYMSPEQARGRAELTIRSDIFALGLTLYELSASHPFGRNQFQIGVISPRPLASVRNDLPAPFTQLVDQMICTRLADRPTNVASRFSSLLGAI